MQGTWVWALVKELRSHMQLGQTSKQFLLWQNEGQSWYNFSMAPSHPYLSPTLGRILGSKLTTYSHKIQWININYFLVNSETTSEVVDTYSKSVMIDIAALLPWKVLGCHITDHLDYSEACVTPQPIGCVWEGEGMKTLHLQKYLWVATDGNCFVFKRKYKDGFYLIFI